MASMHRIGCPIPYSLKSLIPQYQSAGNGIYTILLRLVQNATNSTDDDRKSNAIQLYRAIRAAGRITCLLYPMVADFLRSFLAPCSDTAEISVLLEKAINGRKKLHEWHLKLQPNDPRFVDNIRHEAFLNVLIEVHRIVRGWPA